MFQFVERAMRMAVRHIGGDGLDAVRGGEVGERARAALARRNLCLEIGDVERGVARRPVAVDEMCGDDGVEEISIVDDQHIVEENAFVLDAAAVGGHRAGGDAAEVGVVAARGHEEAWFVAFHEHRHDDGDVGEVVRAAVIGGVERVGVAAPDTAAVAGTLAQDRAHAFAHRAEVYRHVRGVGDQPTLAVEDRAREVEPLADVDRRGAVLKRAAHFLGDRHEKAVEDFEADRVGSGQVVARDDLCSGRARAGEEQSALALDLGAPAGFDDRRRKRVDDDRGAGDGAAGGEGAALVERDPMLGAREPCGDDFGFGFGGRRGQGQRCGSIARLGQFDADAVDDEIVVRGVAEALAEGGGEGLGDLGGRGEREFDRVVAVGEANEEQGFARGRGTGGEIGAGLIRQLGFGRGEGGGAMRVEFERERALADRRWPGEAHTIG